MTDSTLANPIPIVTPFPLSGLWYQTINNFLGLYCCGSMLASSRNDVARTSAYTCLSFSRLGRTTQALASTSRQVPARIHQRKHSSSKPSSASKNEAGAPSQAPTEAKVPSSDTSRRSSTRLRRKARDSIREPLIRGVDGTRYNLPSVPSTQHLHPLGTSQVQRRPLKCLLKVWQKYM